MTLCNKIRSKRISRAARSIVAATAGIALSCLVSSLRAEPVESYVTENGIRMILVRGGTFTMGNSLETDAGTLGQQGNVYTHGGEDERPVRRVSITYDFYISETEVLANQFAKFQEDHQGASHFYPYTTGISWEDAVRFTEWMNHNEGRGYRDEVSQLHTIESAITASEGGTGGRHYRLPTEAEWEYVARAGSADHFSSGPLPPASGEPNAWGVKNMHTDALEWVLDWYGDYPEFNETDPVGPATGVVRVVRGGGLNMPYHDFPEKYKNDGRMPFYRRSANRAAAPPGWRGRHNIGFRIVAATPPKTRPRPAPPKPPIQFVRQNNPYAATGPDPDRPWFRRRETLPIPPANALNPEIAAAGLHHTVHGKNHNPALAACPNGDLLALFFSASAPAYEDLPDVAIIGIRLRFGAEAWDLPGPFFDIPGTKDIGPVLTLDGTRLLFACGGSGLDSVPFRWRTSNDNGATWSPLSLPLILGPRGDYYPQPVSNFLKGSGRTLYLPTDGSGGNTLLWASRDAGVTWRDTGGRTGGRHTVFVNRADGAILGLGGKATDINGFMPKSVSHDGGRSWKVSASPFPAVGPGGQKPALIRLASGRLFFASDWLNAAGQQPPGFDRTGAYVALSEDEGETWIVKDLPGLIPHERWVFRNRPGYRSSPLKDGTLGYCIAAQGPNGLIHLLNSSTQPPLHFEMNEAWILDKKAGYSQSAAPAPEEAVQTIHESHPDGSKKARWSVRPDSSGRMLLHGTEEHWYASGIKEYKVTWANGRKTGLETHWDPRGRLVWQWEHHADGTSQWTQFRAEGSVRHLSTWKDNRLINTPPKRD